jgi:phosphoglycolate phosphatase-like HAD superfamily hydrolase
MNTFWRGKRRLKKKRYRSAPDLFLEAAHRLQAPIGAALAVGDSVWDMQAAKRAHARGLGLRSGGTPAAELSDAGADRVFDDPADLLTHVDELLGLA